MKSTYKNLSLLGIALPPIGSRAMPSKDGLTHFSEHSPCPPRAKSTLHHRVLQKHVKINYLLLITYYLLLNA